MGKNKGKGGSSGKKDKETPKCTCTDPYKCSCGNRPDRPSKGHKWDPETQAWGGKGHKQKGASGQTASKASQAQTTEVGKTQIQQWQRLPSQLLNEVCQRQKRPRPKFKEILDAKRSTDSSSSLYKYRVILPDPKKNAEKDLFFVPAHGVANPEQAKEEAALLALLHLTPDLPHERKLPEPYKTTWKNAIQQLPDKPRDSAHPQSKSSAASATSGNSGEGAKASQSLLAAKTYTSLAEKRKQTDEKRRQRNARIRRHEAIRMANRNHQVFMSARIRQRIEAMLRGDSKNLILGADDEEEDDEERPVEGGMTEAQEYIEERLIREGFTRRQARAAYQESSKSTTDPEDEETWDAMYEMCLQWLLIHLAEDQLPVGFDPTEGTLEVISSISTGNRTERSTNSEDLTTTDNDKAFAIRYGLSFRDASIILRQANDEGSDPETIFWKQIQSLAGVELDISTPAENDTGANKELLAEEIETLESIFASDLSVVKNGGLTTITIALSESQLAVSIQVADGYYPQRCPLRCFVYGAWPSKDMGVALHVELAKFLVDRESAEPYFFDIHGHVQQMLMVPEELSPVSLFPSQEVNTRKHHLVPSAQKETSKSTLIQHSQTIKETGGSVQIRRRPRPRGGFWSTPPNKSPSATPFPRIDAMLDRARKSLPAAGAREQFLSILNDAGAGGRVMLVTGETGCGKTTQIPQFVLEEFPESKIVVAQPRRLAAVGVATRVANERGEDQPGVDSVGYVVRGDNAVCDKSRLVFCTTGVLLRQMQNEGALDCLTHIIVDEVHERHLDSDVLLGLLKKSLKATPHLRVILMSATLDADRFAAYWSGSTPQMHIPGRTFPVDDFFLEDVLSMTGYIPSKKKKRGRYHKSFQRSVSTPWADSEFSDEEDEDTDNEDGLETEMTLALNKQTHGIPIEELVKRVDESNTDNDLLARLVKYLVSKRKDGDDGSILVFLPGAPEINQAMETIKRTTRGMPVFILPLHGGLQPKEQTAVFRPPPPGSTKVILSTNICETSITIPDCTIVIDGAREKQSSYDPSNRMPLLVEQFASKASLKQRRGRAGRVRKGVCYKLISRNTWAKLPDHGEPEIKRCALEQTLLSLIFLGVERGSGTFLSTLLDPPNSDSIEAAELSLRKIGAITAGSEGNYLSLTPLGAHLAAIPAPPTVGKLLVMGAILGCRSAALVMGAGLSVGRSPFLRIDNPKRKGRGGEDESFEESKAKNILNARAQLFKTVGNSDHALLAAIFKRWEDIGKGGKRKQFCDTLGLSFVAMRDTFQLANQLDSSLSTAGYFKTSDSDRNGDSWRVIRACAVSAMAPSQLVKVVRPATTYAETAEGAREMDGEARDLKFFVRADALQDDKAPGRSGEERVFIHPSSANFSCGSYSCPWLVYHTLVRTSKPFLRDVTECSAYSLLLFGGELDVKASAGTITVDGWATLAANGRIASLVGGLRKKVTELLDRKVSDPSFDITGTVEMRLIVHLIKTDGV